MSAISLLLGTPANAQDAQKKQDIASLGIEEMVVTAQKREENMQAVPIAISTLSAVDLERRGVQNPRDLLQTMPNVGGFEPPGGKGSMSVSIRGVSAGSPGNISIDTSTAMYIDGVLIGKMVGAANDVAELERVEVLRGPQGTLYGRNATGGAINFITRKPSGEFGGKITGTTGNKSLWGLRATMDTPTLGVDGEGLGTLKASVGAQTRRRDGFQKNTTPVQDDFDNLDRQAYRMALRWEPTDAVTVDYAYDRTRLDETNPLQSLVGLSPLAINPSAGTQTSHVDALNGYIQAGEAARNFGAGPLAAAVSDPTFTRWLASARAMRDAYSQMNHIGNRPNHGAVDARSKTTNDTRGNSLTIAWQVDDLGVLGDVEFKSITAERKLKALNVGDLDGVDNTVPPGGSGALHDLSLGAMYQFYAAQANPLYAPSMRMNTAKLWSLVDEYGGAGYRQYAKFSYRQFSQELQMVGTKDRLEYAVGLYYFDDSAHKGNPGKFGLSVAPVGPHTGNDYKNDTTAKAFYSQFTYTPPILEDRLAVTLGYRHTSEKKTVKYLYMDDGNSWGNGLFSGPTGVNLNYTGEIAPARVYGEKYSKDFSNNSGAVTFAYQLSDDTNVFVRWASGYRSGGYNGDNYSPTPFKEETIKQWEIGVKSDVLPGTLRVNASAFRFTVEDMQVSQIEARDRQLIAYIGNAGEATRWGTELEVQWSPTDNLLIAASWAHMSGDFEKYPELCGSGVFAKGGTRETCLQTKNAAKRPMSPDNQLSLVTDWVFASTDWADFMAHLEIFWQEKTYAAALWTNTYTVAGDKYPVIFDQVVLKKRALVNARLGMENVEFANGTSLRASLWARNLLDKEYNVYGVNLGGDLGSITAQYGEPRTYGLDLVWEF